MANLYNRYKTNKEAEVNGVRHVLAVDAKGVETAIWIARAGGGNVKFLSTLNTKTKPYQRNGIVVGASADVQRQILREAYAETVIVGWENMENEDGTPMEFSKANALQLITDLDDLFTEIVALATNQELYRADRLEDEAKN
jgi:hypothetical protein